jgi:hypothetical protein
LKTPTIPAQIFIFFCGTFLFLSPSSTQDLAQETSCGQQLDSAVYRGVIAKSNGGQMGTDKSCADGGTYGLQYQCVEYVKRFYSIAHGVDTSSWAVISAVDFFPKAGEFGLVPCRNGESKVPPAPDDILVFDRATGVPHGHVAIVTRVTNAEISIIEQNWSTTGTANLGLVCENGIYRINHRISLSGYCAVLGWLKLPQLGWQSFVEGNPGISGDGVFIHARPIFSDESGFQLSTPFPLGKLTDGFTVSVFLLFDPGDFHSLMLYFVVPTRSGSCAISFPGFGIGGDYALVAGRTFFNGVVGYFINFPQSTIQQLVSWVNNDRRGCNLTANDLFLGGMSLQRGYYQYITVLDATAILPGQSAVPTGN